MNDDEKVTELTHPLIEHKISILRDVNTVNPEFRRTLAEISGLMVYEATKDMKLHERNIETPVMKTRARFLAANQITIVPVLRAGLGMVDGIMRYLPTANVGHIGVYRNEETLEPVYYYCKMPPDIAQRAVILVDPMLATGGSANYAIDYLKGLGVKKITFLSLISAPEGIRRIHNSHPDVRIFTARIDEGLNEKGYIFPGLGDAGDRIFGTV